MRVIRDLGAAAGFIAAWYVAVYFFHLSPTQVVVVGLCLGLWVLSYQINTLKEEKPKFKKKRLDALLRSKPIEVKHKPPKNLTADGQERFGAEAYDFEFFREFWFFGEAANRRLVQDGGPWRLQEIDETEISGFGLDVAECCPLVMNCCSQPLSLLNLLPTNATSRCDHLVSGLTALHRPKSA
jgi:hypothetical protein